MAFPKLHVSNVNFALGVNECIVVSNISVISCCISLFHTSTLNSLFLTCLCHVCNLLCANAVCLVFTGTLYVSKALVPGKLTVHVSAIDGGGLRALADAVVNITVADAASIAQLPTFSQSLYKFSIMTNASMGTTVGSVTAMLQSMALGEILDFKLKKHQEPAN